MHQELEGRARKEEEIDARSGIGAEKSINSNKRRSVVAFSHMISLSRPTGGTVKVPLPTRLDQHRSALPLG